MDINKWDSNVPVEKSSYIQDEKIEFINVNEFVVDPKKLTMIDLFCGAGGFAVGCSWAGFQSVLGIDHLEPAMETWCNNHPHSIGCLGDITKVNPEEIQTLLEHKGVAHINLITGGVPCQGFSIANRKHNDNDERNFLFLEYMRFVKVFMPDYLILENVSGMRSTAGGQFEQNIRNYMEDLGYTTRVKLVNAADYLRCREGKTFEDRRDNLVLVFGKLEVDEDHQIISISNEHNSSIAEVPEHNEVGLFVIDGEVMCKRYMKQGRGYKLVPDNSEHRTILGKNISSFYYLGRVVLE